MHSSTARNCSDAEEVLVGLIRKWKDARTANILKDILSQWGSFSDSGRIAALNVARVTLEERTEQSPVALLGTLARDLLECAVSEAPAERAASQLAAVLAGLETMELPSALMVTLSEQGMRSPDYEVRALALRLFLQPPLKKDAEHLAKAVPFLRRRGRGPSHCSVSGQAHQDLVTDDELLPLLHDADPEVCRLCEVVLRSRGLEDQHIILARLISDERPLARLEVLQYLEEAHDLAPGVWLRRLCHDSSAAVRAAAVRAAASYDVADLRDRLREMAQNDASETVRQLAGHYWRCARLFGPTFRNSTSRKRQRRFFPIRRWRFRLLTSEPDWQFFFELCHELAAR